MHAVVAQVYGGSRTDPPLYFIARFNTTLRNPAHRFVPTVVRVRRQSTQSQPARRALRVILRLRWQPSATRAWLAQQPRRALKAALSEFFATRVFAERAGGGICVDGVHPNIRCTHPRPPPS